jgi:hypothetical protein
MKTKDILGVIISLGVITGMIFGAINYFAKAEELRMVEMRLDQKILKDRRADYDEWIFQKEEQCKKKRCTEEELNQIRQWKLEQKEVQEQLDQLKKK